MAQGEWAGVAAHRHLRRLMAATALPAEMVLPELTVELVWLVELPYPSSFHQQLKIPDRLSADRADRAALVALLEFPALAVRVVAAAAGRELLPMAAKGAMAQPVEQTHLTLALPAGPVRAKAEIAEQLAVLVQLDIPGKMESLAITRHTEPEPSVDLVGILAFSKPMVRKALPVRAATPSLDQLTQKS
jgi:hypothetical protein